jgi:uncharacterized protein YaiL (DUF2058 family)
MPKSCLQNIDLTSRLVPMIKQWDQMSNVSPSSWLVARFSHRSMSKTLFERIISLLKDKTSKLAKSSHELVKVETASTQGQQRQESKDEKEEKKEHPGEQPREHPGEEKVEKKKQPSYLWEEVYIVMKDGNIARQIIQDGKVKHCYLVETKTDKKTKSDRLSLSSTSASEYKVRGIFRPLSSSSRITSEATYPLLVNFMLTSERKNDLVKASDCLLEEDELPIMVRRILTHQRFYSPKNDFIVECARVLQWSKTSKANAVRYEVNVRALRPSALASTVLTSTVLAPTRDKEYYYRFLVNWLYKCFSFTLETLPETLSCRVSSPLPQWK